MVEPKASKVFRETLLACGSCAESPPLDTPCPSPPGYPVKTVTKILQPISCLKHVLTREWAAGVGRGSGAAGGAAGGGGGGRRAGAGGRAGAAPRRALLPQRRRLPGRARRPPPGADCLRPLARARPRRGRRRRRPLCHAHRALRPLSSVKTNER